MTTTSEFSNYGHWLWIHAKMTVAEWAKRTMVVIPKGVATPTQPVTATEFFRGVKR